MCEGYKLCRGGRLSGCVALMQQRWGGGERVLWDDWRLGGDKAEMPETSVGRAAAGQEEPVGQVDLDI